MFTRSLGVHGLEFRDDEIFYFRSTQEMVATDNVMSPTYFGENRFQKPILFYWLVLVSYKIFGVNWAGARLVSVVFAALTVCMTWLIGKALFNRRVAGLSASMLMTIPLFFRHAKNVVPDMALNFFIVAAIYCAICVVRQRSGLLQDSSVASIDAPSKVALGNLEGFIPKRNGISYSLLFFVSCGLGFMIKGFAALIVPILTVLIYSFIGQKKVFLSDMRFGRGIAIMLLIMCPWFVYMIAVHGTEYLSYMVVDETKNRLVQTGGGNVIIRMGATFFDHVLFYLEVIGSYFAPWSVFMIGALPLSIFCLKKNGRFREGIRLMLVWFFVVFCFFSMMYFAINHYMLVLTTPFVILVSWFFWEAVDSQLFIGKMIIFLRKYMTLFILTMGTLAFSFLFVFLAGAAKGWLFVFFLVYMAVAAGVVKSRNVMTAPMILAVFLFFVFAQSSILGKAGVTSHAVLQGFAETVGQDIQRDPLMSSVIGVGSHDIHEKEFQVYFDRRVVKAAGSTDEETRAALMQFFKTDKRLYCLITEQDYQKFLAHDREKLITILKEDYIFRRRISVDKEFFKALVRLDQATVRGYLKEKIILIKRESYV